MASEATAADGDWARLRAIAEQGRERPLLGGPSLLVWGLAIAIAYLLNWALLTGVIAAPGWVVSAMWFALMGGAALLAATLQRRTASEGGVSTANRVSRAVWQMGGAFLATLSVGLVVFAAWASRDGAREFWLLLTVMPPVTFGVYGVALAATAVAGEARWLLRYAWVSLAFTIVTAALIGRAEQSPVAALGVLIVSVLPGLRMARARG